MSSQDSTDRGLARQNRGGAMRTRHCLMFARAALPRVRSSGWRSSEAGRWPRRRRRYGGLLSHARAVLEARDRVYHGVLTHLRASIIALTS